MGALRTISEIKGKPTHIAALPDKLGHSADTTVKSAGNDVIIADMDTRAEKMARLCHQGTRRLLD